MLTVRLHFLYTFPGVGEQYYPHLWKLEKWELFTLLNIFKVLLICLSISYIYHAIRASYSYPSSRARHR